ncbi:hypothetical protein [Paraprevotella clara]|jgi:hypothetical protein|uniref:Uncharacterized protein n=1 Tax=Paraprevotella clara TaxID=454154 RepID=A0A6N3GZE9_9BACT|nr:hypothetical protein [Paraprevotella clara]
MEKEQVENLLQVAEKYGASVATELMNESDFDNKENEIDSLVETIDKGTKEIEEQKKSK